MTNTIPVSAIVPTSDRSDILISTLRSLSVQSFQPEEIHIIDASTDDLTFNACSVIYDGLFSNIIYHRAELKGAAFQRNQAFSSVRNPFVLFMDDDIILDPDCIEILWRCINSDERIGGVNAMIINQRYLKPGKITSIMYRWMHGKSIESYAGKCIGPAWNLLPEDRNDLPPYCKVEWLNTTCTLYRKTALPSPVFLPFFKGYSLMEDLALSIQVAKGWKLYNARKARIFHDSQPGIHKKSSFWMAKMEMENRFYVMRYLLNRRGFSYLFKLGVFELFGLVSSLNSKVGIKSLVPSVFGKLAALFSIIFRRNYE